MTSAAKSVALLIILLSALLTIQPIYSQQVVPVEEWAPREILVEMPLKLNIVFMPGEFAMDEAELEAKVREIMPWYAPYIVNDRKYLGINFTEIDLSVIEAPRVMEEEYAEFIEENKLILRSDSSLVKLVQEYFQGIGLMIRSDRIYWVDAWEVEEWLYEKGMDYLGIGENDYTIYFIVSSLLVDGVVEYYIDGRSIETGEVLESNGMSAFGGVHRLYFVDLTSIPLGSDRCEGEANCKSATPKYYPPLWETELLEDEEKFYEYIATYITEIIIYIFFRGYLWRPRYEINYYEYLLVIDATEYDEAEEILADFSYDVFGSAIASIIPYAYGILEYDVIDVDDYPELRDALFSTLQITDRGAVVVDCEVVPQTVFNLDIIERKENVRNIIAVLFVFDVEAYVCREHVLGRAFRDGAIAAVSSSVLRMEGPSITLYHEAGHVLGLRHPHDADPYPWGENWINWLYDWSATPMSYNSACGLKSQEEELYFVQMDYDSLNIGTVIYLLNKTRRALYNGLRAVRDSGLGWDDIPRGLIRRYEAVKGDYEKAVEEMRKYNFFNWLEFYGLKAQKASAFDYALFAYDEAVGFSESVEDLLEYLVKSEVLRVRFEEALERLEELRKENEELRAEVEAIKESYEQLLRRNSELQEKLKHVEESYEELREEYEELKEMYAESEKERSALEAEVESLRSELRQLKAFNMALILALVAVVVSALAFAFFARRRRPPPPPPTEPLFA